MILIMLSIDFFTVAWCFDITQAVYTVQTPENARVLGTLLNLAAVGLLWY